MESPSTQGQNSPEYEQPVLPLPEFEQINQEPAKAEQAIVFSSLREYATAWRDTIRARRNSSAAPENTQLSFEYPPHPADDTEHSTEQRDREKLDELKSKRSFYTALGERALKVAAPGNDKLPEAPKPASAFQRHVTHKTEKKIRSEAERIKIKNWDDVFFGTERGQVADLRATKRAKRERRRELKRAYRDGAISVEKLEDGLRENMKTVVLKDTKERATEKRQAQKAVDKLRKTATQPLISRKLDQKVAKLSTKLGIDEGIVNAEETDPTAPVTVEPIQSVRKEGNTFYYEKGTLFKPENAKKFDESFFRKKPQQKRREKTPEERGARKDRKPRDRSSTRPDEIISILEDMKPKFHHYFGESALLGIDAMIKPVMDEELRNLPEGIDMTDDEKDAVRLAVIRRELGEDGDEEGLAENIRDAIRAIRLPKKKTNR